MTLSDPSVIRYNPATRVYETDIPATETQCGEAINRWLAQQWDEYARANGLEKYATRGGVFPIPETPIQRAIDNAVMAIRSQG